MRGGGGDTDGLNNMICLRRDLFSKRFVNPLMPRIFYRLINNLFIYLSYIFIYTATTTKFPPPPFSLNFALMLAIQQVTGYCNLFSTVSLRESRGC